MHFLKKKHFVKIYLKTPNKKRNEIQKGEHVIFEKIPKKAKQKEKNVKIKCSTKRGEKKVNTTFLKKYKRNAKQNTKKTPKEMRQDKKQK